MALSVDLGPTKIFKYSCDQIGLSCKPLEQTKSKLVPWCCMYAAYHIIKAMNKIALETGLHYELDSGSLLGKYRVFHKEWPP